MLCPICRMEKQESARICAACKAAMRADGWQMRRTIRSRPRAAACMVRQGIVNPAVVPYLKHGQHSRAGKLAKVRHLTASNTPPSMQPEQPALDNVQASPLDMPASPAANRAKLSLAEALRAHKGFDHVPQEAGMDGSTPPESSASAGMADGPALPHGVKSWPDNSASSHRHPGFAGAVQSHLWAARLPARALIRNSIMAGVFILGSTIGVAATWWATQPASHAKASASAELIKQAQTYRLNDSSDIGQSAAFDPAELPYDGRTSGSTVPAESIAALSSHEAASGSASNDNAAGAEDPVPSFPAASGKEKSGRAHGRENKAASQAAVIADGAHARKNMPPPQQRQAPRHMAQNKQSDPIWQLAEEDRKATARPSGAKRANANNGRSAAQNKSGQTKLASAIASTRLILARCEQKSNFILREHCKWDVCSGQWGKNGCPSFEKQASVY